MQVRSNLASAFVYKLCASNQVSLGCLLTSGSLPSFVCYLFGSHTSTTQGDESTLEGDAADALLNQARNAGDPFLAVTLYQRVLQARPNDTTVMGEAADLMLHAGETAAAKEVRPLLFSCVCHEWKL